MIQPNEHCKMILWAAVWLWAEGAGQEWDSGTSDEAPAEAEVKGGGGWASGMVEEVAGRGRLGDLFWR